MRFAVTVSLCLFLVTGAVLAQVSTRVEDFVIEALSRGDVYVAPQWAGTVDEQRLQQVANELKPFAVKFVVVPLPDASARHAWASGLRRYLNIRNGVVIVLVPKTAELRGGVSASSDVISKTEITRIVEANIKTFTTQGYTQGLEQLARAFRDDVSAQSRRAFLNTTLLIGIPAVLVVGGVAWGIRRRAREIARLKARLLNQRAQVLEGIEYLDGYIDVLPEGEDASRAREHRQRAAELQAQAGDLMDNAKRPEQLWRAEHLLDKAQMSVEKAKKYILRAGGDTSVQVEEEPQEPTAEGVSVMIRPNDRTYACFFCSKPPTLGELQPVEVTVGDQTRKVWACKECAEQLRLGETPAIRAIRDGERARPWYDVPDYDPYRDYGRPYPGMDWVSLLLLGSILSHPGPVIIHEKGPVNVEADTPEPDAGGVDWWDSGTDTHLGSLGEAGGSDWLDTNIDTAPDTGGADFFDSLFGGFEAGDIDAGGIDFGDFGDFGGDVGGGDF
ncbi:MAG: hypothetical protein ACUVR7_12610 [Armatimonadota bacterium]